MKPRVMPSASPPSLQRRLVVWLGLVVAIFWAAAAGFAGFVIRHETNEVFDSALQEVVQRVLPLAYADILAREADDAKQQRLPDVGAHEEYITYVVRDRAGRVLLQSHDADPARFPPDLKPGFDERGDIRFYTERAVSGSITVSAVERRGHRAGALRKVMGALLLPLLLLLPAVMLAAYALVRRALMPVTRLGAAIATRGEGDLSSVSHQGLPQEIGPVAEAINALLERLRRALEAERSFTANSAHELRTPVAGALAQAQRLRADLGDHPAAARLNEIESALQRLARLTQKLLQLAKAEGGALLAHTPQDLRTVVPFVLDEIPDAGRVQAHLPQGPVISPLDIDVFAIALRNLVENALKHGDAASPVTVALSGEGLLSVSNGGAMLTKARFEQLCQRFARGETPANGAGLGLAIVSAIARGAGGHFTMVSPAPKREDGVEMRLQLPLA